MTAFAGKFGIIVEGKGICENDFDIWGGGPGQTEYVTAKNKSMAKYAEEYPHSTLSYGAFGQNAIREAVKQNKPLCLSISFKAPHKPASPDPKLDHVYAGKKFTKPANFGRKAGRAFFRAKQAGAAVSPGSRNGSMTPNTMSKWQSIFNKFMQSMSQSA